MQYIILVLVIIHLVYSYLTYSKFNCPDCPECPTSIEKEEIIPNNKYVINYIYNYFFKNLNDDTNNIEYLKNYIIFPNNYIVKFDLDAESIINNIKKDLELNIKFDETKLKYIQSFDSEKIKQFNQQYSLTEYPSPLIKFEDSNLLFGFIKEKNKWMILLDVTKFN